MTSNFANRMFRYQNDYNVEFIIEFDFLNFALDILIYHFWLITEHNSWVGLIESVQYDMRISVKFAYLKR